MCKPEKLGSLYQIWLPDQGQPLPSRITVIYYSGRSLPSSARVAYCSGAFPAEERAAAAAAVDPVFGAVGAEGE